MNGKFSSITYKTRLLHVKYGFESLSNKSLSSIFWNHTLTQQVMGISSITTSSMISRNLPNETHRKTQVYGRILSRNLSNEGFDEILTSRFNKAAQYLEAAEIDGEHASSDTKLNLFGYYKQATQGPSSTSKAGRPGLFDLLGRAKWDKWKSFDGITKKQAMEKYIQEVETTLGVKIEDLEVPSTTMSSTSSSSESMSTTNSNTSLDDNKMNVTLKTYPKVAKHIYYPRQAGNGSYNAAKLSTVITKVDSTGIAELILNRPKRGNAFNMQLWAEYREAFDLIRNDGSCRVVILSGAFQPGSKSSSFSTGMDLEVFAELPKLSAMESCEGRKREGLGYFIQYLQDAVSEAEICPVPVIAKISGQCIGAAVDIITACDLRYCTTDSFFSIKETDLAIVADVGTLQRLPGLIGQQRCRELAYTGRTINGKEAEEIGLVLKCFDSEYELNAHVNEVALAIAKKSPLTIRGVKKTILYNRDHNIADSLEQVKLWNSAFLHSNDLQEAFKAMMMKSSPEFKQN